MAEQLFTFARLLAPILPADFVTGFYGQKALHIPGKPQKLRQVCSGKAFAEVIDRPGLWTGESLKLVTDGQTHDPAEYCNRRPGRDNQIVPQIDAVKVQALLDQGATMIAELVESQTAGIRAAAQALEMGLGAHVSCNAYLSQQARRAFNSHFDTMEVFVLQIEGTKQWRVYEGRFDNPIERPGFSSPYFSQSHHEQARGALDFEVELSPGDVLYVPAGVYHDALASSETCLHLSFGLTRPTVLDYFRWLLPSLEDFPEFRAFLPDYARGDDARAQLQAASARLAELLQLPGPIAQFGEEQQRMAHAAARPLFAPPMKASTTYRVAPDREGLGAVLSEALDNPKAAQRMAGWMIERDWFTARELTDRFHQVDEAGIKSALEALTASAHLIRL